MPYLSILRQVVVEVVALPSGALCGPKISVAILTTMFLVVLLLIATQEQRFMTTVL